MSEGAYRIIDEFEKRLSEYTGAPYVVAIDNGSNAIFLSLYRYGVQGKIITIPCRTYVSVPCEIIHAGGIVKFRPVEGKTLRGAYNLEGSNVIDSALRFSNNMYVSGKFMCLSFTGHRKHLNLGKGGAILTDDYSAYLWFRRARYSGRREGIFEDYFDMLGWNFRMMPEVAIRGILMMEQFYDVRGIPKDNEDLEFPYPDLSVFSIFTGVSYGKG